MRRRMRSRRFDQSWLFRTACFCHSFQRSAIQNTLHRGNIASKVSDSFLGSVGDMLLESNPHNTVHAVQLECGGLPWYFGPRVYSLVPPALQPFSFGGCGCWIERQTCRWCSGTCQSCWRAQTVGYNSINTVVNIFRKYVHSYTCFPFRVIN